MFCIDSSALIKGRSYGLIGIEHTINGVATLVDPSTVKILLGKYPFAFIDKERNAYAAIDVLADDVVLSYKTSNQDALELTVADTAITQITSTILPTTLSNVTTSETITSTLSQGTTPLKRKYTLGPT
jgi:hypothetical protein